MQEETSLYMPDLFPLPNETQLSFLLSKIKYLHCLHQRACSGPLLLQIREGEEIVFSVVEIRLSFGFLARWISRQTLLPSRPARGWVGNSEQSFSSHQLVLNLPLKYCIMVCLVVVLKHHIALQVSTGLQLLSPQLLWSRST